MDSRPNPLHTCLSQQSRHTCVPACLNSQVTTCHTNHSQLLRNHVKCCPASSSMCGSGDTQKPAG